MRLYKILMEEGKTNSEMPTVLKNALIELSKLDANTFAKFLTALDGTPKTMWLAGFIPHLSTQMEGALSPIAIENILNTIGASLPSIFKYESKETPYQVIAGFGAEAIIHEIDENITDEQKARLKDYLVQLFMADVIHKWGRIYQHLLEVPNRLEGVGFEPSAHTMYYQEGAEKVKLATVLLYNMKVKYADSESNNKEITFSLDEADIMLLYEQMQEIKSSMPEVVQDLIKSGLPYYTALK